MQQHLPVILSYFNHSVCTVRLAALMLVKALLRQGLICPLDAIQNIIALQGDSLWEIRSEALEMIQLEDCRHPTFLDNRFVQGMEMARKFQKMVLDNERPHLIMDVDEEDPENVTSNSAKVTSIFSALYMSCVRPVKKRRVEFLKNALRRCLTIAQSLSPSKTEYSESHSAESLATLKYLLHSLAHLQYDSLEDVDFIVQWVHRNVNIFVTQALIDAKTVLTQIDGVELCADDETLTSVSTSDCTITSEVRNSLLRHLRCLEAMEMFFRMQFVLRRLHDLPVHGSALYSKCANQAKGKSEAMTYDRIEVFPVTRLPAESEADDSVALVTSLIDAHNIVQKLLLDDRTELAPVSTRKGRKRTKKESTGSANKSASSPTRAKKKPKRNTKKTSDDDESSDDDGALSDESYGDSD